MSACCWLNRAPRSSAPSKHPPGGGDSRQTLTEIATTRALVDDDYRAWLKTVTREDVRRMVALTEAARAFEQVRARGYRTPHE